MRPTDALPRSPELPPELERREVAALDHDASLAEVELVGAPLADQRSSGVTFEIVKLAGVELSGSRLEHLTLVHAALSDELPRLLALER